MPAYRNDSNRGGRSQVPNRLQGQQRQAQTRPVQRPMYRNEILAQQQMQQMQQSRSQAQPAAARKPRRYYDYSLLFGVIFIFALGLLVIYSSSQYTAMLEKGDAQFYFKKQLMIGSAGLAIAIVMSLFDYRLVKNAVVAYGAYLGACGLC